MHKNKASSNSNPIHIDNLALVSIRSENGRPVLEINGVTVETRMVVQPVPTFVKANIYKQYGSFGTQCCQKLQEIQELLKNDGSLYCKEELYSTHRGWVYCTKFGSGDFVTINLLNITEETINYRVLSASAGLVICYCNWNWWPTFTYPAIKPLFVVIFCG